MALNNSVFLTGLRVILLIWPGLSISHLGSVVTGTLTEAGRSRIALTGWLGHSSACFFKLCLYEVYCRSIGQSKSWGQAQSQRAGQGQGCRGHEKFWSFCCCVVAQLYSTLCNPMDCSPPGSSGREAPQTRMLESVAISFSKGSSPPRDRTWVCCLGRWIL